MIFLEWVLERIQFVIAFWTGSKTEELFYFFLTLMLEILLLKEKKGLQNVAYKILEI